MLKRIMFLSLFMPLALPLAARTAAPDSTYTFRFPRGEEMFFIPYRDNATALSRLILALDSCRARLDGGYSYVNVTGYVPRGADEEAVRRLGYSRNSRVKSELITRAKLAERVFVTDKVIIGTTADGLTDVVVVTFPASVEKVAEIAGPAAAAKVEAYNKKVSGEAERVAAEKEAEAKRLAAEREKTERQQAERERLAVDKAKRERAEAARLAAEAETAEKAGPYRFALRTNLLRWATLTPDLGIEWRVDRDWSVLVNGSWTSWSRDNKNRRYALWEIAPEVRYYTGKEKRGYIGVMYKVGEFNYKFSTVGKQGDLMGGGITSGYQLELNKSLSLDFNLGLGYIHADHDKYEVIDGIRVRQSSECKNWWGPVSAGVTLMWKLF